MDTCWTKLMLNQQINGQYEYSILILNILIHVQYLTGKTRLISKMDPLRQYSGSMDNPINMMHTVSIIHMYSLNRYTVQMDSQWVLVGQLL